MNAPNHPQPIPTWNPAAQTMQQPAMARALTIVRLMTTPAAVLVVIVGAAQLVLPEGHRPSDMIGGFHGGIDSSDILAKREATIAFERDKAKAVAREQAKVQWEMEVLRQQMQTLHESMTAKSDQANAADWVCVIGRMIAGNSSNQDWRNAGQTMSGAWLLSPGKARTAAGIR